MVEVLVNAGKRYKKLYKGEGLKREQKKEG